MSVVEYGQSLEQAHVLWLETLSILLRTVKSINRLVVSPLCWPTLPIKSVQNRSGTL